jgi:hypothetical protein
MNRRRLLQIIAGLPVANSLTQWASAPARAAPLAARVRPDDPQWPTEETWKELGRGLDGRLIKVASPLSACVSAPSSDVCAYLAKEIKNPYYLGQGEILNR